MKKMLLSLFLIIGLSVSSFAQVETFIGDIKSVAFNFEPRGWLICDGRPLPIAQYQALFALIGTYYGGNGTTTFNLPDLRGKFPVGYSNGINGLPVIQFGQNYGSATTTLSPLNNNITQSGNLYFPKTDSTNKGIATLPFITSKPQPFNNYPPSVGINYIICVEGIFPSRW